MSNLNIALLTLSRVHGITQINSYRKFDLGIKTIMISKKLSIKNKKHTKFYMVQFFGLHHIYISNHLQSTIYMKYYIICSIISTKSYSRLFMVGNNMKKMKFYGDYIVF